MTADLAAAIGIEAMLAPIAGQSPAGTDLRTDFTATSLYYRLRDARAEARAAERTADAAQAQDGATPLEWRTVRQLATEALTRLTKDLEIAAWLTEALVRGEGIAGIEAGARLMGGLVQGFWNHGLYPQPDEDGIATRVAPVTGLNGEGGDGTLVQPLRKQTFFHKPDGAPVAFWEFDASMKLQGEADAKKRQQRIAAGVRPWDDMERDARTVDGTSFAGLRASLRAALAAWVEMGTLLDEAAGKDSPPTGRIKTILDDMMAAVTRYAPAETAPLPQEAEAIPEEGFGDAAPASAASPRKAESREDMLRELARIADYFRRTEPHSPLAYTLDDAVRRGRMSWPELLTEIVPDATQRGQMLVQLGIRPQG